MQRYQHRGRGDSKYQGNTWSLQRSNPNVPRHRLPLASHTHTHTSTGTHAPLCPPARTGQVCIRYRQHGYCSKSAGSCLPWDPAWTSTKGKRASPDLPISRILCRPRVPVTPPGTLEPTAARGGARGRCRLPLPCNEKRDRKNPSTQTLCSQ